MDDIEKDAEEVVQSHIEKHSKEKFQYWLSEGQSFEDEMNCPYCGQDIKDNSLLKAYKTHFNRYYIDLQKKVSNLSHGIEAKFSNSVIENLHSIAENNKLIASQWSDHLSLEEVEFDQLQLLDIFSRLRELCHKLAQLKQQNLLGVIRFNVEKEQITHLWQQVVSTIDTYNQSVDTSIACITNFKQNLASEDIQKIEEELRKLNLIKVRQNQSVCDLLTQWNNAKEAKQLHEQNKVAARNQLDSLMTQTLQQYQSQINALVRQFGASFEIDALSSDYRDSGLPRSSYGLKVKGQSVKLSASAAPSFSTALSEGDKRTLAFAFFIARVKADTNLSNKIRLNSCFREVAKFRMSRVVSGNKAPGQPTYANAF